MAGVHPNVPAEEIRLALSVTGTLIHPGRLPTVPARTVAVPCGAGADYRRRRRRRGKKGANIDPISIK